MSETFPLANGVLPLAITRRDGTTLPLTITGGPFRRGFVQRFNHFGVCLTETDDPRSNVHLPIEDFSVPDADPQEVRDALWRTLKHAAEGYPTYVGCLGGWGRTGLFLALLAKATGEPDPIAYVRQHYTPRAVETREQELYVEHFDVEGVLDEVIGPELMPEPTGDFQLEAVPDGHGGPDGDIGPLPQPALWRRVLARLQSFAARLFK